MSYFCPSNPYRHGAHPISAIDLTLEHSRLCHDHHLRFQDDVLLNEHLVLPKEPNQDEDQDIDHQEQQDEPPALVKCKDATQGAQEIWAVVRCVLRHK
jgi:hypothetical protein